MCCDEHRCTQMVALACLKPLYTEPLNNLHTTHHAVFAVLYLCAAILYRCIAILSVCSLAIRLLSAQEPVSGCGVHFLVSFLAPCVQHVCFVHSLHERRASPAVRMQTR